MDGLARHDPGRKPLAPGVQSASWCTLALEAPESRFQCITQMTVCGRDAVH